MRFQDRPLLSLEDANAQVRRWRRVYDCRLLSNNARRIFGSALARCTFDHERALDGLNHFGGRILVKSRNGWPGSYLAPKRALVVWFGLYKDGGQWAGKNAWKIQANVLHEIAHGAGDLLTLTGEQRVEIFTALHGHQPEGLKNLDGVSKLPEDWALHPEIPFGHGHSWFDETYEDGVGEAFAETFLAAFTDIPASSYSHETTPESVEIVRKLLG